MAESTISSERLPDTIGKGAVIVGPSGCGKSLLLKWVALSAFGADEPLKLSMDPD